MSLREAIAAYDEVRNDIIEGDSLLEVADLQGALREVMAATDNICEQINTLLALLAN